MGAAQPGGSGGLSGARGHPGGAALLHTLRGAGHRPEKFCLSCLCCSGGGVAEGASCLDVAPPSLLAERWPYLVPAPGCTAVAFDPTAGVVDPLAFCRAQFAASASAAGGTAWRVVPGEAVRVAAGRVELRTGEFLECDRVVVCGGASSRGLLEDSGLLLAGDARMAGVRVSRRTVALLEVSADCARGLLGDMPSLKYAFREPAGDSAGGEQSRVEGSSVYVLPPVQYPERGGRWFVKVGGGPNDWMEETSAAGLGEWLASPGDPESAVWLEGVLRGLMPGVPFLGPGESMACVTTISEAEEGDVFMLDLGGGVAAVSACQGKGVGPADAVGAEVASRLLSPP